MSEKYHHAARDGYLDKLRDGNRREMNAPDEDGCTPTMLAAQSGNLDALKMIIIRGGDPDKMDLLGFSSLHHAAQFGHMNCVSYLINFGANFWIMDNDGHTALDIAGLEGKEDIVKVLDNAQAAQQNKNPKVVQKIKEHSLREAEKNQRRYEKLQEKASKDMEKTRRKLERTEIHQNGDVRSNTKSSIFDTLTGRKLKIKNKAAATVSASNGGNAYSDHAYGTHKKGTRKGRNSAPDFQISNFDESGKRTLRSVRGTLARSDAPQVMYVSGQNGNDVTNGHDENASDGASRPRLANVFPGTNIGRMSKSDPNLLDSGIDSFDSLNADDEEETVGLFERKGLGHLCFLAQFDSMPNVRNNEDDSFDEIDANLVNGDENSSKRISSGTDSTGTAESVQANNKELPWQTEDVDDLLDDDEDDTEYTPVVAFLQSCNLLHYTSAFTSQDVDMDALMRLTPQDLSDMGLVIGPQRKLLDAVNKRRVVLSEPAQMYDSQL